MKRQKDAKRPELSIVILCYKSGKRIINYVKHMENELLKEGLANYELVLVGNYLPKSNDPTPRIIRELANGNPRISPVVMEKKGMMGWDAISGFTHARGKSIALIDGDGQMPSFDIVRLYRVLKSGEFDFVKTFRIKRLDGVYRRFISNIYNIIFHVLFPDTYFKDINSKPKLITRKALSKMKLNCPGWFLDGEIMLEVRRLNLSFAEIPTVFHENEWRASFVKFNTIFEFLKYMLTYRFKYWFRKQ